MTKLILKVILLTIVLQSCDTINERDVEIEDIKNSSIEILAHIETEILTADALGETVWKANIDSVQSEWMKIHKDSAELGLLYAQEFEKSYLSKSQSLKDIAKIENKKILANSEKELKKLKKKFTFKQDEFQDVGFYTHKTWGKYWPNRKTLTSGVNSLGQVWLKSNYSDDDWLFHTSITVLIGKRKLTSPTVPTYSKKNITDNDGGRIWEVITYDNIDILKDIANNTNETIKVRFNGSEFYNDATLSKKDKKALKECYELSELLKLTK